ncbi:MAG TPA: chorismate mutase [Terracidiphilus sp.]|nr:chorismate mutase [Terracidiphilus sp.]
MTLEELRKQIDDLDRQLVELLSERARAALMIGHLKVKTSLPVYEPAREKIIYSNVRAANKGPLPDIELTHIYERIIDVMRALQRNELASERNALANAAGSPAAESDRGAPSPGQGTGSQEPQRQSPAGAISSDTPETGTKQ